MKPIERELTLQVPVEELAKDFDIKIEVDPHDDVYHDGYSAEDVQNVNIPAKFDGAEKVFPNAVAMALESAERSAYVDAIEKNAKEGVVKTLEAIEVQDFEYTDNDSNSIQVEAGIESASLDGGMVTIVIKNPEHLINAIMAGVGLFSTELPVDEKASDEEIKKYLHHLKDYFEVYGAYKPKIELDSRYSPDIDDVGFADEIDFRISELSVEEIAEAVLDAVDSGRMESEAEALALAAKLSGKSKKEIAVAIKKELKDKAAAHSSRADRIPEEESVQEAASEYDVAEYPREGSGKWGLFHRPSKNWVIFGSKKAMEKRKEELESEESEESEESVQEGSKKWIIKDWAGNLPFGEKTFASFEHGEEFLSVHLGDEYEANRGEYDVVPFKGVREKNYLDPKDPRAGKTVKEAANKVIKSGNYKGKDWSIIQTDSGQLGRAVDYQMVVPGVFKSDFFTSLEKWSIDRQLKQAKSFIDDAVALKEESEEESFKIEDIGVEWPDYFRGAGVAHTQWDDVFVGVGNNQKEALDDAAEQLAQVQDLPSGLEEKIDGAESENEILRDIVLSGQIEGGKLVGAAVEHGNTFGTSGTKKQQVSANGVHIEMSGHDCEEMVREALDLVKDHYGVDEADVERLMREAMKQSQTELPMYYMAIYVKNPVNESGEKFKALTKKLAAKVQGKGGHDDMFAEAKDEIASILIALNSSGNLMGKYPIGNQELTKKVKELELAGKISYDDKFQKWSKGKKKVAEAAVKPKKWIVKA